MWSELKLVTLNCDWNYSAFPYNASIYFAKRFAFCKRIQLFGPISSTSIQAFDFPVMVMVAINWLKNYVTKRSSQYRTIVTNKDFEFVQKCTQLQPSSNCYIAWNYFSNFVKWFLPIFSTDSQISNEILWEKHSKFGVNFTTMSSFGFGWFLFCIIS